MERNRLPWHVIVGCLLVAGGLVFLLGNLFHIDFLGPLLWSGFFLIAAILFLTPWLRDRRQWWAIIPVGVCTSIAAVTLLNLLPGLAGRYGGALFLFGLALTFFAVYLFRRKQWWALIPAGFLALLAGTIFVSRAPFVPAGWEDALQGSFFLAGLGLAFLILCIVRREQWWAMIPGGVLLVLSIAPIADRIPWLDSGIPLIIFGGFGVVFLALYLSTHMRWSLWVAVSLACFGILVQLISGPALISGSIFAVVLIALGGFLLLRRRNGHQGA